MKKADKARLDAIHNLPCICCVLWNEKLLAKGNKIIFQPFYTQAHHIVDHGYRRLSGGDQATLPLCGWHHMGMTLTGCKSTAMESMYGPSLADRKRAFIKEFGDERELLEKTNKLLDTSDMSHL